MPQILPAIPWLALLALTATPAMAQPPATQASAEASGGVAAVPAGGGTVDGGPADGGPSDGGSAAGGHAKAAADKAASGGGTRDHDTSTTQIAEWFADLANNDATVRDAAKWRLMGLSRGDLPALRKLVQQRRPLAPSQAVSLKDIVAQVYLASDQFDSRINGREGFLGIRPTEVPIGTRKTDEAQSLKERHDAPPQQAPQQQAPQQQAVVNQGLFPGAVEIADPNQTWGVLVVECFPGFAGARSLQNGDIILGIVERPGVQFHGGEFSTTVRAMGAGQKIHFDVLRQGQIIRVEVLLGPRPDDAESAVPGGISSMEKLLDRRTTDVNDYWDSQFAPLLTDSID